DSDELIRHLYLEAAKTQRYGDLTDDEALALITINPAKQLGIDQWVGSIEAGKHGDIAIFDKHPLSVYTIPQMTIVDGVIRFDIKNDVKDMRMFIDPEEKYTSDFMERSAHINHCMMDVSELLLQNDHASYLRLIYSKNHQH